MNGKKNQNNTSAFIEEIREINGKSNVITDPYKTKRYRKGFRSGEGKAIAVILPINLVNLWKTFEVCARQNIIIIMQAANTGLTEGSTPNGDDYDRDVVVINSLKLKGLHVIKDNSQIVAFPGTTLWELEETLKPLGREPHSVIGSSCIGASVIGGICNSSGGALVNRGPVYTEMALYGRINEHGRAELINHLGIELGSSPEEILTNLEKQNYTAQHIVTDGVASNSDYSNQVRDINENTPSRFNADARRLYEASGSAGKLIVFAARLDTFPLEKEQQVFYIGTNSPEVLSRLRTDILVNYADLPVSAEYLHRDIFDISETYGKDVFYIIDKFGTKVMPQVFSIKGKIDAVISRASFIKPDITERCIQKITNLLPQHLPKRIREYRQKYEHHLILKMSGQGIAQARLRLAPFFATNTGEYFECTSDEGKKAMLHRFSAAGAAVRYQAVHHDSVSGIVALDIALRRNDSEWFEVLPEDINRAISHKLYYGHFLCNVFHQDYIIKKGYSPDGIKAEMLKLLDSRGAEYPAEHNVGHIYKAKPQLKDFYKKIDPTNALNPGTGKTTKAHYWRETDIDIE